VAEPWWSSWVAAVAPYAVLLRLFIDGRVTGEEFEVVFLPLYKKDATSWPPEIFDVLDGFFADVDDFCADPALRAEVSGIDEDELRRRATIVYQRLAELAG
jgi:Bacterial self-protective colicin-like immunity